jgi:hypothetical protein
MRKLLALLAILAGPALAQQPNGTINAPIYATGYISQVGGANVTTKIIAQPNHPTNLNIYTTGAISGTWSIQLPNPAFEGQILSFSCGGSAASILITSSDGSTIDSNLPTSCVSASTFAAQFDQRSNIWRYIGYSNSASISPGQLPAFTGGDCTTTAGSVALNCTKTGGVVFGYFATGTDAANLTGTVSNSRLSNAARAGISMTPYDFGAVGGGADDSIALQAMLTYACANGGTYTIAGEFYFATALSIVTCNNATFKGASASYSANTKKLAILHYTGLAAVPAITIGNAGTILYNVNFDEIILDGGAHATDLIHTIGVNHSLMNVYGWNATNSCFHFSGAVEIHGHMVCSVNDQFFTHVATPSNGIVTDAIGTAGAPAGCYACRFDSPLIEGVSGIGLNLSGATNTVINSGASEANGTGLYCDTATNGLVVSSIDLEVNTTTDADIACNRSVFLAISPNSSKPFTVSGSYNVFQALPFASSSLTISGNNNDFGKSNLPNTVTDSGTNNVYNWVGIPSYTGSCGVDTGISAGDNTGGYFVITGACTNGTVTQTFKSTAPVGWICSISSTNQAAVVSQYRSTTTTATYYITTSSASDAFYYQCTMH